MKIGIDIMLDKDIVKNIDINIDDALFSECCPIKTKTIIQEKVDEFITNHLDWGWYHK